MNLKKPINTIQRPINVLKKVIWKKDIMISVMRKQIIKHYIRTYVYDKVLCAKF